MDTARATAIQPPIMLMGSPRSGTTWLAKILDSHPNVLYRHEPDSLNVRPEIPFVPLTDDVTGYLDASRDYLALMCEERAGKSAGSQPMFDKRYRGALAERWRRLLVLGVKAGERLPGGAGRLFSKMQIPDLVASGETPQLFIKSVSSLCRTHMFSLADPRMRFIHIIRHPCAYVASTLRGNRLGLLNDDAYVQTLAAMPGAARYGLTLERLQALTLEEQLAARWMLQNEKVMEEMAGSDRCIRVIYEELCARPLEVAEGLFRALGLDFDAQTREFIADSSVGKGGEVRYFDLRRDSSAAASRWMQELAADRIEAIRALVSPSAVGQLYFPPPGE